MATDEFPRLWLSNFHDVYMNSDLLHELMRKEPLPPRTEPPELMLIHRRFRFERLWQCFLFVCIEAWESSTEEQRSFVRKLAESDFDQVQDLISIGKQEGKIEHLRAVRNYMCHRDKREYWDDGRVAVVHPGMLEWTSALDGAFSSMILAALKNLHKEVDTD